MKRIEVVAAVLRKEGKIFCAQRKDEGPLAKKWEFPGGKIETGETREEALVRELYEELNIQVQVGDFIMTIEHQYPTFHITMHAYYCNMDNAILELSEHLDSKWLNPIQLGQLDWAEADIPIVKKVMGAE
ncbi:MAG: (deoxy)nucleoside triphosphate pyrophosphohydrolase [Peptostreptococcales bacterium]